MRFMMLLPAPAGPLEKAVAAPNKEPVTAMHKFNEEIAKPGVLLAAEGLPGTSKGSRIPVSGGKRIVTDGPFTEAKEVIAGFWMIQVKKEEALERCPLLENGMIEIPKFLRRLTSRPNSKRRELDRSCEPKSRI